MALGEAEYEAIGELESESEAAERARFRRPTGAPSFRPRPSPAAPMYVTQMQLEAALTRVDGKIKTVTDSAAAVSARVAALQTSAKKEVDDRKKAFDTQGKDVNQKIQLLALLPLLLKAPTATGPQTAGAALRDEDGKVIGAVSVPSTSSLDAVLPLLLVSGFGGTGGGLSLGTDSGGDSSLLLLALVLAFGNK